MVAMLTSHAVANVDAQYKLKVDMSKHTHFFTDDP